MDELFTQFLVESRELIAAAAATLDALARDLADQTAIDAGFRAVHTLKGSVALFDMAPAGRLLHDAESMLERARKGDSPLNATMREALVGCIDRVDAWIDAMERTGALPPDAAAIAERLSRGLEQMSAERAPDVPSPAPDWLGPLTQREDSLLAATSSELVAFRYVPDDECFFRGDDPLALIEAVPELRALLIAARRPWGGPEALEIFQANLIFEGLSGAPIDLIKAHFRLMADQVTLHAIRPRRDRDTPGEQQTQTLRIAMSRLDQLADGVEELIVAGNGLEPIVAEITRLDQTLGARLRAAHGGIERASERVQRAVTGLRLVPIAPALRRLPRIVRELATELGKEIDFRVDGDGIEVDKAIADALYEPLLHLLRNAIDHGIETPSARTHQGKPRRGTLELSFRRVGERLEANLADDGAGIDLAHIRELALRRGLISTDQTAALDDRSTIDLIFAPGFSSAKKLTNVSGRGVGMDAVRTSLRQVGAEIVVKSALGKGTVMRMSFPLNAITTQMLIVCSGVDRYAVPFEKVTETAIVPASSAHRLAGGEALILHERTVPLVHLAELLGKPRQPAAALSLMVTHDGDDSVAIAVDGFSRQINATVRRAGGLLAAIPGVAGTTILGDGEVVIVLDLERLIA